MDKAYVDEVIYFTSDEFADRVKTKDGKIKKVSWDDLNSQYNKDDFYPVDGKLVRIADHLSALMEADISIKHGITSNHLQSGKDGMLSLYKENETISGINVNKLFHELVN